MRHILLLFFQLTGSLGRLLRSGGVKTLLAENLLLKHQLMMARRSRRRAPNLLKNHWVSIVLDVFTRRMIGCGAQAVAGDGPPLCRMFNQANSGQSLPKRLSYGQDPLFEFSAGKPTYASLGLNRCAPSTMRRCHTFVWRGKSERSGESIWIERFSGKNGSGTETRGVQELLQSFPHASIVVGNHLRRKGRRCYDPTVGPWRLQMASSLSWPLRIANRSVNSPPTSYLFPQIALWKESDRGKAFIRR